MSVKSALRASAAPISLRSTLDPPPSTAECSWPGGPKGGGGGSGGGVSPHCRVPGVCGLRNAYGLPRTPGWFGGFRMAGGDASTSGVVRVDQGALVILAWHRLRRCAAWAGRRQAEFPVPGWIILTDEMRQ